jgi:broad specificity phosphatase PhoE
MNRNACQRAIILARHGRTLWNLEGRYQGQSDSALCPIGLEECESLAERLGGMGIGSIYTSPLNRARVTARIVAERLRITSIQDDQRLAEIHFGEWEGLTQTEVRQRWPALLKTWKSAPDAVRFPGGETLQEARARLRSFLTEVASKNGLSRAPTLVVTHAGLIRLAILDARQEDGTAFRRLPIAPASIWRFTLGEVTQ